MVDEITGGVGVGALTGGAAGGVCLGVVRDGGGVDSAALARAADGSGGAIRGFVGTLACGIVGWDFIGARGFAPPSRSPESFTP
ncbi:MAG: hypothetical protein FWD69_17120 [Polyangiaceae bacterium]|nr:hypothetical protein [Polyangiaceae bacterium]